MAMMLRRFRYYGHPPSGSALEESSPSIRYARVSRLALCFNNVWEKSINQTQAHSGSHTKLAESVF